MLCIRSHEVDCPITAMFDIDGEMTDSPDMAITVIVLLPDNTFLHVECLRRQIVDTKVN